jgi:V/A-type H+-transporting ATPase subunit D
VKVRHPPGRAGRPWLRHRLDVARRGAELLDDKFRALLRERARLDLAAAQTRADWERCARAAEHRMIRAAVMSGERELALAAAGVEPVEVVVRWRNVLGVSWPSDGGLVGPPDPQALAGGGAALLSAAAAHRRALEAGLQAAVADGALRRIDAELRATRLRRNAIRHTWIPAHEEALRALDLTLEEVEREDGARLRRVTQPPR